ncbi:hypothetical protein YC2023_060686 [Brassica napus]
MGEDHSGRGSDASWVSKSRTVSGTAFLQRLNIFSISCLLPFQSCSASGFCVTVSAAVSNIPFQPNFTNSIFSQISQPPVNSPSFS